MAQLALVIACVSLILSAVAAHVALSALEEARHAAFRRHPAMRSRPLDDDWPDT
jgi:hypothetical protein